MPDPSQSQAFDEFVMNPLTLELATPVTNEAEPAIGVTSQYHLPELFPIIPSA
jgi:hypothetical protein